MADIIDLPDDFIGNDDQRRLESFGGHLISRGYSSRWGWNRERGVDVAFEIFWGGPDEKLFVSITRHRVEDVFYATDAAGTVLARGSLEHVMAVVDDAAAARHGGLPA
jgi:hypothetical protein